MGSLPVQSISQRKFTSMKNWIAPAMIAAGFLLAANAQAQTPPGTTPPAPATVTATCKDGTPFSGPTLKGACRGHGGVMKNAAAGAATTPAATPATPTTTAASTPPATTSTTKKGPQPPAVAKPGGGPGLVWVNSESKAYHCNGDRWYGKTKSGEYMTESAAKAAGDHPAGNKACTS
jgi:hypothetical protein